MTTTLVKEINIEKRFNSVNLNELVETASKVIVPLGPLTKFAARHPWAGIEQQSFEQVARKLKSTSNVEIYPDDSILQSAWNRGEIGQEFLEMKLQQWLDSQSFELPSEVVTQFCQATLMQEKKSIKQLPKTEIKGMARELVNDFHIPTKQVLQTYSQRLQRINGENLTEVLNGQLIKWCKLFLDEAQAVWAMPNRDKGFYYAWKEMAKYDPAMNHLIRRELSHLPNDATQALMDALLGLEISYLEIESYLEAHLLALPGWAGTMLWRSQQSTEQKNIVMEYLAVRICLEYALIKPHLPLPQPKQEEKIELLESLIASWAHWGDMPIKEWLELSPKEAKARLALAYRFDQTVQHRLWLEAWEQTFEDQLQNIISSTRNRVVEFPKSALAQFAFCIDVRSEPFRRQLEDAGPFETFGTAGFFGLPIETSELGSKHSHPSLPVLFKPQIKVKEWSSENDLKPYKQRHQTVGSISYAFKRLKYNLPSSLLLPEISGPWLILQTMARSFVPRSTGDVYRKIRGKWLRKPQAQLSLDRAQASESELPIGFTLEEKVHYVRQALKMMSLTENFSPLVVICGHGSHSTNNPYASALDCGACGGASSGFNARVLATLCNLPVVRKLLELEGIIIPKETVFVAAEHITTLDELQWLYVPKLTAKAKEAFEAIQKVLPKVSEQANAERIPKLPGVGACSHNHKNEAKRLGNDWSEVRPEWGLARNATFIIGNRALTQYCNLDARAFLHNYDWKKDPNGPILANIISGPATVAQWINLQYYASTVAPHYYGSGNKTTQTVTAGIGVMQGNASDLLSGLPWQSVMQSDEEAYHAPLRLLVVIEAPRKYVLRMLDQNPAFLQKIQNGWIRLASIDQEGNWESWS
ncbi:uncharacterized protein YbcC (UPF0753/DUF2309 family) [Lysinibacillus composti]|uniref:Probable inorganic carbon transporter subunit DabA n=1 Tax=Lysinibacillus composti TaxID=720633 RepID=A0A3N9UCY4_9BACI|nr:putative inorganic carbon transporter subunit DabA [Lysinibacillus composti]MBM7609107.1 uncharacterized protein YbcC (UPF0753/DUF2309 family) [Lysinibacillus composti]RQW74167.1 DUF2309 family protein [Lysinibacillus composti]